ncbi:MAG: hypothetical protein O3A63_19020 [Proteobacteria bacterium]|nr:hypothetical protein [Pseudomonadota bacterium]
MGLVSRLLEERGIATVCVATGRDLINLVKAPRALFVNHPMGNNFGAQGDSAMQTDILRTALAMIVNTEVGGELKDYPTNWAKPFQFAPGGARKPDQQSEGFAVKAQQR